MNSDSGEIMSGTAHTGRKNRNKYFIETLAWEWDLEYVCAYAITYYMQVHICSLLRRKVKKQNEPNFFQ